jgi:hypothetical protein
MAARLQTGSEQRDDSEDQPIVWRTGEGEKEDNFTIVAARVPQSQ